MTVHQDPEFELLFEFYERVDRKALGSRATTKRAWSLLEGLPSEPRIVDLGCGAGASALVLAECGADVTAVDVHEPFLKRLRDLAVAAGSADRITTVQADMADPPLPDGGYDVVWSDGAIYLVGFAAGLARWRRLLRPEGWIAVSEATWQEIDHWRRYGHTYGYVFYVAKTVADARVG